MKVHDSMTTSGKVGGMLEYLQALATRLLVEEDGQGTTEYGLILVLVSIIAMAVLQVIGLKVTGLLNVVF